MKIRGGFHQTMYSLATSAPFNLFVVAVVIVNTVQMILLTSAYQQIMHGLHAVPQRYLCCTSIYRTSQKHHHHHHHTRTPV